jgi:hypothetical protein
VKKAKPAVDPEQAVFERLAALEPSDPNGAIAGYLALAKRSRKWADNAMYAAARVAHDRRDTRAKTLLETYLARFPRGANAALARQLLEDLRH